jgi:hypothetical protein
VRMSTRAQRATIGVVLVAALSACSSDAALADAGLRRRAIPPPNRSDASVSWSSRRQHQPEQRTRGWARARRCSARTSATWATSSRPRSRWSTSTTAGPRLPALEFPLLGGEGVRTVSDSLSYNGLIEASSVVVDAAATVGASDSLELRASDTIPTSAAPSAPGSGGVRLVAGRAIYVDGTIETDGPIQLELTSPTGTLRISGRLVTLATEGRSSGGITMYARGQVELDGTIETGAARYGDSGSIAVTAYGAVVVQSDLAQLVAGTSLGGTGGSVELSSELRVQLALGRLSGGNLEVSASMRTGRAGHVTIEAPEVLLERAANLSGGGAPEGAGGKVSLRATGAIVVGRSVQLVGGGGRTGGNVELESATASVAGRLRAGSGEAEGRPRDHPELQRHLRRARGPARGRRRPVRQRRRRGALDRRRRVRGLDRHRAAGRPWRQQRRVHLPGRLPRWQRERAGPRGVRAARGGLRGWPRPAAGRPEPATRPQLHARGPPSC